MNSPILFAILSAVALIVFLTVTNPATLPSFLLIIPFALLFTAIYAVSYAAMRSLGLRRLRGLRLSLVGAGLPVSLLLLQSIGQLTLRDVLTILVFFMLAYFYISRLAATSQKGE